MARVPLTIEQAKVSKLVLHAGSVRLTPEQFFRLCRDNPDLRLELTAQKEIVIMPPCNSETGWKEGEILGQLRDWAKRDGTGFAFGSSAGFTLPNSAVRGPDACWVRREKWKALKPEQRRAFSPICPDFVIELRSPNDTLAELNEKMAEYIANGAQLGWVIDPIGRTVVVHRPGSLPQRLDGPETLSGDPVLAGFVLDLAEIWQGPV